MKAKGSFGGRGSGAESFALIDRDTGTVLHPELLAAMLRAAAGKVERLPKDVNPDLRRALEAMLAADPAKRPTAAEARGGTAGTRTGPAVRSRPTFTRRQQAIGLAALLALVAVVVGIVVAVSGGDDGDPVTAPATTTTEACTDLPYQPCGSPPAPNTDGERCDEGTADFDGDPENGCEAVSVPSS